ncbi:MAG: WD40 repeat domain-containing protein [Acidobacteriota bacterium]
MVLWSVPDGRLLRSLKLDDGRTRFFSFSADGTQLFTITEMEQGDGGVEEVRSWPVAGGEPTLVARLQLESWNFFDLTTVDPTGTRLAWMEGGRLFVARSNGSTFDQRSAVEVVHAQDVVMFCFDSRGNKIATIDAEGTIRLWSLDTGLPQIDRTLVSKGSIYAWLRFDSTANWLVSRPTGIRNLQWPPDAEPWPLHFADRLFEGDVSWAGVSVHPEGQWLAGGNTASVSFWPLAGPYPFVLRGHEGEVMAVRYTPDGRWLISSGEDGTVRRWPLDPDTSERSDILHRVDEAWGAPKNLALPPDGSFVVFATNKGRVAILPFDGGPIRELAGFKDMITGLAVGPRGRFVAAGSGYTDKTESLARVWDLRTGEVHVLDEGNLERIFVDGLYFTPEGELLVTTDKLRRWDFGAGSPHLVSERKIDKKGVARDFSPDGRRLLDTEGGHGSLFLVDLETGVSQPLTSHSSITGRAIFDPSGSIVISATSILLPCPPTATGSPRAASTAPSGSGRCPISHNHHCTRCPPTSLSPSSRR